MFSVITICDITQNDLSAFEITSACTFVQSDKFGEKFGSSQSARMRNLIRSRVHLKYFKVVCDGRIM